MRSLHAEYREGHTTLLTSRQCPDFLQTGQTGDSERSQMGSVVLFHLSWELRLQEGYRSHIHIELVDVMLSEVCDSTSVVMRRPTYARLDITGKKLDKGGFSRSIRTDDGDPTVEAYIDIDTSQDGLFGCVAECDFIELEKGRRDLLRIREFE